MENPILLLVAHQREVDSLSLLTLFAQSRVSGQSASVRPTELRCGSRRHPGPPPSMGGVASQTLTFNRIMLI